MRTNSISPVGHASQFVFTSLAISLLVGPAHNSCASCITRTAPWDRTNLLFHCTTPYYYLHSLERENDQCSSYVTTILAMSQWGLASSVTSFEYTIRRMKLIAGSCRPAHPAIARPNTARTVGAHSRIRCVTYPLWGKLNDSRLMLS
jgi:hypothetical protein